jgi:predicted AAA+ superfamily ATPase
LYKDILEVENVKNSKALFNLLELLALQLGNEVSYQELANNLGINVLTIKRYIDLLEKCFVVFTLHAFSRNKRKEITKSVKIIFLTTVIIIFLVSFRIKYKRVSFLNL